MTRAPGFPRPERISFGRALHAASLSAFAGSAISAVLFCVVTVILVGLRGWSPIELAYLPILAIMAAIFGSLVALPTSLVLGVPVLWLWGRRIATRPRLYALFLALIGAGVGWAVYEPFFSGDIGVISKPARYACPLFGAVVAGLHPIGLAFQHLGEAPGSDPK